MTKSDAAIDAQERKYRQYARNEAMDLADVLKAHHDKLDEHTRALAEFHTSVDTMLAEFRISLSIIEKRVSLLESDAKALMEFVNPIREWVSKIKDVV
jgi:acyl-CoA reductase-like NAD-dependent aldehyde dehydrogenase